MAPRAACCHTASGHNRAKPPGAWGHPGARVPKAGNPQIPARRVRLAFVPRSRRPYGFEIVIADKRANSEGLQLADLVARPAGLHVLRPTQPNRAWDVLATKLFGGASGVVQGNGLKVFP